MGKQQEQTGQPCTTIARFNSTAASTAAPQEGGQAPAAAAAGPVVQTVMNSAGLLLRPKCMCSGSSICTATHDDPEQAHCPALASARLLSHHPGSHWPCIGKGASAGAAQSTWDQGGCLTVTGQRLAACEVQGLHTAGSIRRGQARLAWQASLKPWKAAVRESQTLNLSCQRTRRIKLAGAFCIFHLGHQVLQQQSEHALQPPGSVQVPAGPSRFQRPAASKSSRG